MLRRRNKGGGGSISVGQAYSFSDEFDSGALDTAKWVRDSGGNYGTLETFTADTDLVTINSSGQMVVSAIKDQAGARPWRGALLTTAGKFTMKTGTVEIRAALPTIYGAWPAFWFHNGIHGETGGPQAEIDIMEVFPGGGEFGPGAYLTLHDWSASGHPDKAKKFPPSVPATDGGFHTWTVSWDAAGIEWWLDGVSQGYVSAAAFNSATGGSYAIFTTTPMYLIFNMAVGIGGQPGPASGVTRFDMFIDYVRISKTS